MNPFVLKLAIAIVLFLRLGVGGCFASDYFKLVPPNKHNAVGMVTIWAPREGKLVPVSFGTGTLIAPNLVLTAAHVVSDAVAPQWIQFKITLPKGKSWERPVMAYRTHPHFLWAERMNLMEAKVVDIDMLATAAADVAILRLVENAPEELNKFPQLGDLPTEAGTPVEAVGFGAIEGSTAAEPSKRSGMLEFYEKSRQNSAIFRTPPGKLERTNHGDSGGPLLKSEDGVDRIVAITQGYRKFDKLRGLDPSSYGLYTSIEDNRTWIAGARKELSELRFADTPYFYLRRNSGASAQLALTRQQIAGLLSIGAPADRVINQVFARGMNEPIPQEVVEDWIKGYKLNPDQYFIHASFSKKPTPKTIKQPDAPTSDAGAPAQKK